MNSYQQHASRQNHRRESSRVQAATALMSKSRKNYQNGTHSRISNRYNNFSANDSLTEDEQHMQQSSGEDRDLHRGGGYVGVSVPTLASSQKPSSLQHHNQDQQQVLQYQSQKRIATAGQADSITSSLHMAGLNLSSQASPPKLQPLDTANQNNSGPHVAAASRLEKKQSQQWVAKEKEGAAEINGYYNVQNNHKGNGKGHFDNLRTSNQENEIMPHLRAGSIQNKDKSQKSDIRGADKENLKAFELTATTPISAALNHHQFSQKQRVSEVTKVEKCDQVDRTSSSSQEENVSDDDDDRGARGSGAAGAQDALRGEGSGGKGNGGRIEDGVLQEIPAVMCLDAVGLNARRGSAMYSFTKNIDYEQITEVQKRRFLREKKSSKFTKKMQQIVPDQVSIHSSMTVEEKENQICSEFGSQNVKFVSQHQVNHKSKGIMNSQSIDTKPKSILKPAGSVVNKTCIQNNVYQSAQFLNKNNKASTYNYRKKSQSSKGRVEVVPSGSANHHQNIEILDQRKVLSHHKNSNIENPESLKKSQRGVPERSGSKKGRKVNSSMKSSTQSNEQTKKQMIPSNPQRRTSPNIPPVPSQEVHLSSGGAGGIGHNRRSSMKSGSTDLSFTASLQASKQQNTSNYDVKAHRNVWDKFGKKDSAHAASNSTLPSACVRKQSTSGSRFQKKPSHKPHASQVVLGVKTPREVNQGAQNKKLSETEKHMMASTKSIPTT